MCTPKIGTRQYDDNNNWDNQFAHYFFAADNSIDLNSITTKTKKKSNRFEFNYNQD